MAVNPEALRIVEQAASRQGAYDGTIRTPEGPQTVSRYATVRGIGDKALVTVVTHPAVLGKTVHTKHVSLGKPSAARVKTDAFVTTIFDAHRALVRALQDGAAAPEMAPLPPQGPASQG